MEIAIAIIVAVSSLAASWIGGKMATKGVLAQMKATQQMHWRSHDVENLRSLQEAAGRLVDSIQVDYAHVSDVGIANLEDWVAMDTYNTFTEADRLAVWVTDQRVRSAWRNLRKDIDQKRKTLDVATMIYHSVLSPQLLTAPGAKELARSEADKDVRMAMLNMKATIELRQDLNEAIAEVYREITSETDEFRSAR